jgi:hypothetical protein
MPVVEIQALPQPGIETAAVLRTLCRELAAELGEPPHAVWAVWRPLEPGAYAEGESTPDEQPQDTHPPLVRVIGFEGRPPGQVEAMLECAARVLARELGLEQGNVFALYDDARSGRLFDGGSIVKRDR